MSMHKIPLTQIEEAGLRAHGLDIGTPSQLSDAFRQGVAWGQKQQVKSEDSVAVPEGWKLVPIKATEAMVKASFDNFGIARIGGRNVPIAIAWGAMLAAAPTEYGYSVTSSSAYKDEQSKRNKKLKESLDWIGST